MVARYLRRARHAGNPDLHAEPASGVELAILALDAALVLALVIL
jgi:hypothetical protein